MKEWIVKDTLNNKYVQELVRCKDCIYYNSEQDSQGDHCDKIHWSRGINWFCADAKKVVNCND